MTEAEKFLLNYDSNPQEAQTVANLVASQIQSKDRKLVDVVLSVGEYLTDDDATVRAKSTAFLAAVIAALDANVLTKQQIEVVRQYFCARIEDASGLKEAAKGLLSVAKCRRFSGDDAQQLVRALFTSAQDLQRHPQGTRFVVLSLLDVVMRDHRAALKVMGNGFIVGVTDLVAGEKDPRNLMIVFSVLKVVIVEWDVLDHAETLFDSVFCYFPITFRPPPDDPYRITAKDLKERLRECIAASKYFAPFAFPALIEKLDSISAAVKKDVLQTLASCAASYDADTISNISISLWDSVKFEVLNAQEDELAEEALVMVTAVVKTLISARNPALLSRFLNPIIKESNERLQEPQQKQAQQTGQILGRISASSLEALDFVTKACIPALFTIYLDRDTIGKQRALLEVFNHLLVSATPFDRSGSNGIYDGPLSRFKDRLFELYSRALMGTPKEEVSFRLEAIRGLLTLCKIPFFLSKSEIGMVVQYMDEVILDEESYGPDEVKHAAINSLVSLSKIDNTPILEIAFPKFVSKLPDSDTGGTGYTNVLEGLARISQGKDTVDLLFRRLLSKLDVVISNSSTHAYSHALLSTISDIIQHNENLNWMLYFDRILEGTIKKSLYATKESHWRHDIIVEQLGTILGSVYRNLNPIDQDKVLQDKIQSTLLVETQNPNQQDVQFTLFTYILAGSYNSIPLPEPPMQLLEHLLDSSRFDNASSILNSRYGQVSIIVNKFAGPADFEALSVFGNNLLSRIRVASTVENEMFSSVWLLLAIIQGLLFRLDTEAFRLVSKALDALSYSSCGVLMAHAFPSLLAPNKFLTKSNHCTVRLLYPQRLFNHALPILAGPIDQSDLAKTGTRTNRLTALAGLLSFLPPAVVLPFSDTLLPLLLQGIQHDEAEVKAASINTLRMMLVSKVVGLDGHVSTAARRLLTASDVSLAGNTEKVRFEALRCLKEFPRIFRSELLVPLKNEVCQALLRKLDDPRRRVRKEAVDCRYAWMGIDASEDD